MKKINIGIVLIIIFFIGIVFYITYLSKQEKEDRVLALEFVEEYFEVYNKYSVLEKEDRILDKKVDMIKYNKYIENMRNELSKYIYDERFEYMFSTYKQRLDNQINGKYMMYEYKKDIVSVDSCKINNEYIAIRLNIKVTVDKDNRPEAVYDKGLNRYKGFVRKQKGIETSQEIIFIKRVSKNNYKILYHMIFDYNNYSFEGDTV